MKGMDEDREDRKEDGRYRDRKMRRKERLPKVVSRGSEPGRKKKKEG